LKFTAEIILPFDMADSSGFIFFGNAFAIEHQVIEKFVIQSDIGWEYWFNNPDFIVPIRHTEADYYAPIKAGDPVKCELSALKVSDSSVTFECEFSSSNTKCISVKSTHVFVDKKSMSKISIPNEIKKLLMAIAVK
tara:strand:+ start:11708 stop:12115 length:408 start_codon:yes stop_codon:yes gene_type:complete